MAAKEAKFLQFLKLISRDKSKPRPDPFSLILLSAGWKRKTDVTSLYNLRDTIIPDFFIQHAASELTLNGIHHYERAVGALGTHLGPLGTNFDLKSFKLHPLLSRPFSFPLPVKRSEEMEPPRNVLDRTS